MHLFELTFRGPPLSLQTKDRQKLQAYKRRVRRAALKEWRKRRNRAPAAHSVAIEIIYFYEGIAPDVDNIVKPIQDALIGIAYVDDQQVTDGVQRKRHIDRPLRVRYMPMAMARRFVIGEDFVYVKMTRKRDLTRFEK